jgi:hypothetical protein
MNRVDVPMSTGTLVLLDNGKQSFVRVLSEPGPDGKKTFRTGLIPLLARDFIALHDQPQHSVHLGVLMIRSREGEVGVYSDNFRPMTVSISVFRNALRQLSSA